MPSALTKDHKTPAAFIKRIAAWAANVRGENAPTIFKSFAGAQFIVRRDNILQMPKPLYTKISRIVTEANHDSDACHGMERMWQYLFGNIGDVTTEADENRFTPGCSIKDWRVNGCRANSIDPNCN